MATNFFLVPKDTVFGLLGSAGANLEKNKTYTFQNVGDNNLTFIYNHTEPSYGDPGWIIKPGQWLRFRLDDADVDDGAGNMIEVNLWVYAQASKPGKILLDEQ